MLRHLATTASRAVSEGRVESSRVPNSEVFFFQTFFFFLAIFFLDRAPRTGQCFQVSRNGYRRISTPRVYAIARFVLSLHRPLSLVVCLLFLCVVLFLCVLLFCFCCCFF